MAWRVIYTKPRNEKKVFERLTTQGIDCYFPCQKTLKQWSDRKKWVEEPVFRSYMFINDPSSYDVDLTILQTAGVVRFLYWLGKPAIVRDVEIEIIKKFLGEYQGVEILSFEEGTQLRVKDGALKDCEGIVEYQTENEVILRVEKLGMSLVAKLSKYHVEEKRS